MEQAVDSGASVLSDALAGSFLIGALRVFWLLSTTLVVLGVLPFGFYQRFLRKSAGRGKLRVVEKVDPGAKKGPLARLWDVTVPQDYFSHFYLVGFMSTLGLIHHTFYPENFRFWPSPSDTPQPKKPHPFAEGFEHAESIFLLALMLVHTARRLCESTMLEKHAPGSRMHIASYVYGLCYYVAAPLTLYVHRSKKVKTVWGLFSWHEVLGGLLFIFANIKQHQLGQILAGLRHRSGPFDKIPVYRIPRGDWFEWVACPHYLAEILLYLGLVVVSEGKDLTIWLMFSWVVANLTYAAQLARRWYVTKFEDYPKERKAIVPLLF
ncbi:3-oxo-5-alpha-steroid 4-dehydrogenase 3 [Klebsormidium nitens]|uniref:3-oxo-5-alpha-steroid 4-dehydrogenase 3 n=1 Tax=Klebsormidium nitens TaxID=105231 RepID=A0A1Y1IHQ4_KLENI|nr:3-oxo-5-alpha-steroid 4-dehydrogenase 3 [Klebsormidium nitens]|eukprot:GAQ88246.1 3-oxo-5-alpha-steroid 4-dehydrogenase 3 [Klebsormidium nitens]